MQTSCKVVRFRSSGMRQCVRGQVVSNVLKDHSPFSFKNEAGQEKQLLFPECLKLEGESSTFLWNVKNKTPKDTVWHQRRLKTSHTHTSHSFWHHTCDTIQWHTKTVNGLTCHSTASCPCPGSADHCAACYRCDRQTQKPATHHIFCSMLHYHYCIHLCITNRNNPLSNECPPESLHSFNIITIWKSPRYLPS